MTVKARRSAVVISLSDVQKRSAHSAVGGSENETAEAKELADLRGLLWAEAKTWKEFAEIAGLKPQTVQRFANGETRRPTFPTMRRLRLALGYELHWIKPKRRKR